MKLTLKKDVFCDALKKACSVIGKSTLLVLSNILVSVKDNKCTFVSTDLNETLCIKVDCESDAEGKFLIEGKNTLSIVDTLPNEDVSLDVFDEKIILTCQKFKANLSVADITEFPHIDYEKEVDSGVSFVTTELKRSFERVAPFAAQDETRKEFCGVNFNYKFNQKTKNAEVTLCATDGHSLSKTELYAKDIKAPECQDGGIIITTKAIQIFTKHFIGKNISDETLVFFDKKEGRIYFKLNDIVLSTLLVSGGFPDFSRVIPKTEITAIIEKQKILNSLKRALLFDTKHNSAKFEFYDNHVNITSMCNSIGNMSDIIDCEYTFEKLVIGLNSKLLEKSIQMIEDSYVAICLIDADSPIKIMNDTDLKANDESSMIIVMPMQIY